MHELVLILLLCLIRLGSHCSVRIIPRSPAWSPSNPPELRSMVNLAPAPATAFSSRFHGSTATPPESKHHRRRAPAVSPTVLSPPQDQGCSEISCSEPLTRAPFGSPCACVFPMRVVLDLGLAPYKLFNQIQELEVEVAAGIFLKQSQVAIIAADASINDRERTRVTLYLLPLGGKFDNTTAVLIYERFWQKKVLIKMSIFGDYEVIYVHYPGVPSSPPPINGGSSGFGAGGSGRQDYPFSANIPPAMSQKMNPIVIAVITLSSFILVLMGVGIVFIMLKWKKIRSPNAAVGPAVTPSITRRSGAKSTIPSIMGSSTSISYVSAMPTCPASVKTFSIAELVKATENFSSNNILGEGGFGRVYRGVMEDGSEVAVKLLTREDQNKGREFIAEVEMLSRLHHRNLVKLIGICIEGRRRCLVYDLVRNGSVESHLHGTDKKKGPLDWDARVKIALGAARGLAYLHEDSNPRVIHRDFKASNVLLEEDLTPKVSDFGLAREASDGNHHISTQVVGTFGYVDPQYAMTGHLLVKSDVYSYGVVLLELLSGRKPVYMSVLPQGPENLVTWARPLLTNREGLQQLIDPSLEGNYDFDDVARVAAIASMCVRLETSQRPFMGEVVQALKLIYKDTDETCDGGSQGQRGSSLGQDRDYEGDIGTEAETETETEWWNSTPRLRYGLASSFITMDYSVDRLEERVESMPRLNRSDPLQTKRRRASFYRLRGWMSENGHLSRRLDRDGY